MSTSDQYLRTLLGKYQVNANGALQVANSAIVPVLHAWRGSDISDIRLSGSVAKGTANSGANDMDLFIELRNTAQGTLQQIYNSLYHSANQFWPVRAQNVSIGIQCGGYHFDLVPGRVQAGYQNWYSLWKNKANTWTQTNVELHIQTVTNSRRIEEIRILKLWRTLRGLDFPSFFLELAVIEALKGKTIGDLASNVWDALGWIQLNIQTVRLVDPSNSNNVVSDDINAYEKRLIANAAGVARSKKTWGEIVW